MTLGPGSDLTIDNFVYDPETKAGKLAMTAAVGVFRFVGGRASKDEPVVINTPTATVGIRGGINYTTVATGTGETETSQAFGKDTTATSKSTGQTQVLGKSGFTMKIAPNQPIETSKIDLAKLNATLAGFQGRPGAGGGGTAPNQNSPSARAVATGNSGQPPAAFTPTLVASAATLGAVTNATNRFTSSTAQSTAAATAAAQSGVPLTPPPTFPNGSYAGGFAGGLFNGLGASVFGNSGGIDGSGGPTNGTLTYTITDSSGNAVTTSRTDTVNLTLGNGIPQTLNVQNRRTNTCSMGCGSNLNTLVASIQNATLTQLGGDAVIQTGRITGGTGMFRATDTQSGTVGPLTRPLPSTASTYFAFGLPATMLPSGPSQFTYNLLSATAPTFADGHGGLGTFTGTLGIQFGVPSSSFLSRFGMTVTGPVSGVLVGLNATVSGLDGATYRLSTIGGAGNPGAQLSAIQMGINPNQLQTPVPGTAFAVIIQRGGAFSGLPFVTVIGPSTACSSSCLASLSGFLAGPGGSRAGILYSFGGGIPSSTGTVNLAQVIVGSAVFRR
jgi:hypothetical protein